MCVGVKVFQPCHPREGVDREVSVDQLLTLKDIKEHFSNQLSIKLF